MLEHGFFIAAGDFYASTLAEKLGIGDSGGFVRAGLAPTTPKKRSRCSSKRWRGSYAKSEAGLTCSVCASGPLEGVFKQLMLAELADGEEEEAQCRVWLWSTWRT